MRNKKIINLTLMLMLSCIQGANGPLASNSSESSTHTNHIGLLILSDQEKKSITPFLDSLSQLGQVAACQVLTKLPIAQRQELISQIQLLQQHYQELDSRQDNIKLVHAKSAVIQTTKNMLNAFHQAMALKSRSTQPLSHTSHIDPECLQLIQALMDIAPQISDEATVELRTFTGSINARECRSSNPKTRGLRGRFTGQENSFRPADIVKAGGLLTRLGIHTEVVEPTPQSKQSRSTLPLMPLDRLTVPQSKAKIDDLNQESTPGAASSNGDGLPLSLELLNLERIPQETFDTKIDDTLLAAPDAGENWQTGLGANLPGQILGAPMAQFRLDNDDEAQDNPPKGQDGWLSWMNGTALYNFIGEPVCPKDVEGSDTDSAYESFHLFPRETAPTTGSASASSSGDNLPSPGRLDSSLGLYNSGDLLDLSAPGPLPIDTDEVLQTGAANPLLEILNQASEYISLNQSDVDDPTNVSLEFPHEVSTQPPIEEGLDFFGDVVSQGHGSNHTLSESLLPDQAIQTDSVKSLLSFVFPGTACLR